MQAGSRAGGYQQTLQGRGGGHQVPHQTDPLYSALTSQFSSMHRP